MSESERVRRRARSWSSRRSEAEPSRFSWRKLLGANMGANAARAEARRWVASQRGGLRNSRFSVIDALHERRSRQRIDTTSAWRQRRPARSSISPSYGGSCLMLSLELPKGEPGCRCRRGDGPALCRPHRRGNRDPATAGPATGSTTVFVTISALPSMRLPISPSPPRTRTSRVAGHPRLCADRRIHAGHEAHVPVGSGASRARRTVADIENLITIVGVRSPHRRLRGARGQVLSLKRRSSSKLRVAAGHVAEPSGAGGQQA